MPISTDMQVQVAHADVTLDMAFQRSVRLWHREGEDLGHRWKVMPANCEALLIGEHDGVAIEGDCTHGVAAPHGGLIHIYGDLHGPLEVGGHSEVVITGDVLPAARIESGGIAHVFVAGNLAGAVDSQDSIKIWVGGDFTGSLQTGMPATHFYIDGDYAGKIIPHEKPALLWLKLSGFATQASLEAIAACGFTVFQASVGYSDVPPGIYPAGGGQAKKTAHGNSFSRWCVVSQR